MTYNDIKSNNPLSPNNQEITIEHNGEITKHNIIGNTKKQAESLLMKTGWYLNSSRNII
jgi:hypothetical protein